MISSNMKQNLGRGVRLFATQIGVAILSIIVYVFVTMFAVSAFSEQVGYEIYVESEQEGYEYAYSHYFDDGEDKKLADYNADEVYQQPIRLLSDGADVAVKIIVQILTLIMLAYLVYGYVWNRACDDRAKADVKKEQGNEHYGFKLGLLGATPLFIIFLLVILEKFIIKTSFALSAYKLTNFSLFYLTELACNNVSKSAQLPIWSFLPLLAILFVMPLVSWFGYYMGYKNINIRERIVYTKKGGEK